MVIGIEVRYLSSLIRTATRRLKVGELARKVSTLGRNEVAILDIS
jgi:hypothetical protein